MTVKKILEYLLLFRNLTKNKLITGEKYLIVVFVWAFYITFTLLSLMITWIFLIFNIHRSDEGGKKKRLFDRNINIEGKIKFKNEFFRKVVEFLLQEFFQKFFFSFWVFHILKNLISYNFVFWKAINGRLLGFFVVFFRFFSNFWKKLKMKFEDSRKSPHKYMKDRIKKVYKFVILCKNDLFEKKMASNIIGIRMDFVSCTIFHLRLYIFFAFVAISVNYLNKILNTTSMDINFYKWIFEFIFFIGYSQISTFRFDRIFWFWYFCMLWILLLCFFLTKLNIFFEKNGIIGFLFLISHLFISRYFIYILKNSFIAIDLNVIIRN